MTYTYYVESLVTIKSKYMRETKRFSFSIKTWSASTKMILSTSRGNRTSRKRILYLGGMKSRVRGRSGEAEVFRRGAVVAEQ